MNQPPWPKWAFTHGRPHGGEDPMPALEVLEGAARLLASEASFVRWTRATRADGTGCRADDADAARWSLDGALYRAWWDGEGFAHSKGHVKIRGTIGTGWIWARWWLGKAGLRLIETHPLCAHALEPHDEVQPRVAAALADHVGYVVVPLMLDMARGAERANDLDRW